MSNPDSSSKIALVTGSSRGLGRSTVINLAKKGVDSIVTYYSNQAEAESAAAEIASHGAKAAILRLDASNVATFDKFVDEVRETLKSTWGRDRFDFLVNNAGTSLHQSFETTTEEQFDAAVNVHFKGVFFLTQKLLPLISDGGRIVNLSSGLARFSIPGTSAYGALKAAIDTLSRYLALELGPRRITVNSVAPGAIATDFSGGFVRDNPEMNKMVASHTALGRVGLPEDIGPMIAALLGDENRWINGQRIEVAGGINL